jgi:hypothetical protein
MTLAGGVKVTLEQNPAGIIARHTYTDAMGHYSFNNLPPDDFRIKVDIAAVNMDSTYYIYYTAGDTLTDNLDYYYDSAYIYVYSPASAEEINIKNNIGMIVYPNPFTDRAFIYFSDIKPGLPYEVIIYDVTGRIINSIKGETPAPVRIDRPDENGGMLFYEVKIKGIRSSTGKLVVY